MTPPIAPATAEQAAAYQRLRGHLAALKLSTAAEHLPALLDAARAERLTVTAALERLMALEVAADTTRRLAGRTRFACLPTPARLDDFDFDAAAGVDRQLIDDLATCRYLQTATNVLLIGPPGVGKTMLSVGLARAAVEAGYRTYFTTAADLAARCHRAAIEGRWATTMRFFAGPTLLVICRRSTPGPTPAPIRRHQPRRRVLPTPRTPGPKRIAAGHHNRHPPTTKVTPRR